MLEQEDDNRADDPPLARRTLGGMVWAYGSYASGRVLVLLSVAALARILSPADFGLVALALIFTGVMETVRDLGVSQALVVSDEREVDERASSAFWFTTGMGVALTALCALASPLAASVLDEPELKTLLPLLGLNFILRALGATHYALAQRSIDFRSRTAGELADVLVRGGGGVVLALTGAGAYSLVIGYLMGTTAMTLVLWAMVRWRPRAQLSRVHIGGLLRFGGSLTGLEIVAAAIPLLQNMIVGRVLGATALGLFTLGLRLPELLVINLSVVAGQVLYPAFASVERERLGEVFLKVLHYTAMIALPMTAFVCLLAHSLIMVAFGDQWDASAPVMAVLGLYALSITLGIPAGTAYKATGRALVLLLMAIPRLGLTFAITLVFAEQGIVAVAICLASVAGLFDLIGIWVTTRLLHVRLRSIARSLLAPLSSTAGLVCALVAVDAVVAGPWLTVVVGAAVGAPVYLGLLWLTARESLTRLRGVAFGGA